MFYTLLPSEADSVSFGFNLNLKSVMLTFSIRDHWRCLRCRKKAKSTSTKTCLEQFGFLHSGFKIKFKKIVIGKQNGLHWMRLRLTGQCKWATSLTNDYRLCDCILDNYPVFLRSQAAPEVSFLHGLVFIIKGLLHVLRQRAVDPSPKAAPGEEDYVLWRHFIISYPLIE